MKANAGTLKQACTNALVAFALGVIAHAANAQDYPNKPIRMIVPLDAGSTVDVIARLIAPQISKTLGQNVVVENLPGAGGITGTQQLVRTAKDGYTIGMVSSNHVINPGIYLSMPYDSLKDITPITLVATVPLVLVVNPSVQAKTVKELVDLAKSKPGMLNYGSSGNGGVAHLASAMLAHQSGISVTHIPYKGTSPFVAGLLSGDIQFGFLTVTAAQAHTKVGKLRALAVSTPTRVDMYPELPTLAESGVPQYSFSTWIAMIAPAAIPAPAVAKLHAAVKAALGQKELQETFASHGLVPTETGPSETEKFFSSELSKHLQLVKQAGAIAQ